MTLETSIRQNGHRQDVRRVGLVVRVSTDRQAANDEGSLKNQLQRLRQHMEYKRSVAGEEWIEVAVYELRAVSGKHSLRSAEFERLFGDIRAGRVNTILCTALDRISRSVKDFLNFFEFINDHRVEFVCLKQNYDTTTPHGRLFVTMMIALAEFEREQTSERTREATAARAERGLWNGGQQLLGYELDRDRKGHLVPNAEEAAVVNFAFDTYLDCGSITKTTKRLNVRGYRTKAYTSRRGKHHAGGEFTISSVQYMLKNPAYVGKKEINRKSPSDQRLLVEAVWPGIVDAALFARVQETLRDRQMHVPERPFGREPYPLSGVAVCHSCGASMLGCASIVERKYRYRHMRCSTAQRRGRQACRQPMVGAELLED